MITKMTLWFKNVFTTTVYPLNTIIADANTRLQEHGKIMTVGLTGSLGMSSPGNLLTQCKTEKSCGISHGLLHNDTRDSLSLFYCNICVWMLEIVSYMQYL